MLGSTGGGDCNEDTLTVEISGSQSCLKFILVGAKFIKEIEKDINIDNKFKDFIIFD